MKDADWERMLSQALAPAAEPEEELNQSIIRQLQERGRSKPKAKKRLSAGLLAAVLLLVLSVSAYAATRLFSAGQVAEMFGDRLLADAFESKDAVRIERSMASGDYHFTLHGLVTGAGLSEFKHLSEDLYPDRTYAVVSITRQDGKPMPDTDDPEYGKDPFFISPLVKGLKPWEANIFSMNGGYSEDVLDGVMYRLISLDEVEMFADRGVYLAISSGSAFYSSEAFRYDEKTGEIHAREDYPGASLLFELPLDAAKADRDKADAYLDSLSSPSSSHDSGTEEEWIKWMQELRAKIRDGETIGQTVPGSVKEMTYDDSGKIAYAFGERSVTMSPEDLFEEGQIGFSDRRLPISGGIDNTYEAVLFHRDENGVITGRIVILGEGSIPEF
ncbi:hypothetical protein [Cohnella algarum]|uniref:hypothetical protein n=1 Tax=Cohnella algarum TaxID=2044859 RepID=UPI0019684239|nr:hypothetical protein [Cohnella algarum]MBN2983715.1 hypothetical protein [Cohnella algarum]